MSQRGEDDVALLAAVDRRAEQLGVSREVLVAAALRWPVSDETPAEVQDLLLEARQLFVGGAAAYSCFASTSLKALQAAELALAHRIGGRATKRRMTFGVLLRDEREQHQVLTPEARQWFTEMALRFRNSLSHPKQAVAYTPGMAEIVLHTAHEQVAAMFSPPSGGEAS